MRGPFNEARILRQKAYAAKIEMERSNLSDNEVEKIFKYLIPDKFKEQFKKDNPDDSNFEDNCYGDDNRESCINAYVAVKEEEQRVKQKSGVHNE